MPEQRYLDALVADLEAALPLVWGRTVHSIFIGGGTPSLFAAGHRPPAGRHPRPPEAGADCEITLEANPGTFEKDRFRAFRAAGVTRLSVGVQSFNDAHLKALGRVHDRAQAIAAVEEAAQAFDTFNLDLMYACPARPWPSWSRTDAGAGLGAAAHLDLPPDHRAQHLLRQVPAAVPEDDLAYAMLDRITEMTGAPGWSATKCRPTRGRATAAGTTSTTGSSATTWALARARTAS
jgi:coproporphyrinogen III oxidase-like Fe-S oxidoreductase